LNYTRLFVHVYDYILECYLRKMALLILAVISCLLMSGCSGRRCWFRHPLFLCNSSRCS